VDPLGDGLLYVYGVITGGDAACVEGLIGLGGAPAEGIGQAGLIAVVSPFRLEPLGEDPVAVEAQVRTHAAVVEQLARRTTVLPTRFGTVCSSKTGVMTLLTRDRDGLLAALDDVAGKVEWGLHVTWDSGAVRSHLEARSVSDPVDSPGTAYLLKKAKAKALDDDIERARARLAVALHQRVAAVASSSSVHRPPARQSVLKASYLVWRDDEEVFRLAITDELDRLDGDDAMGLCAEISGPWPAFNFANVLGEGGGSKSEGMA
jgi:hypothetical protein